MANHLAYGLLLDGDIPFALSQPAPDPLPEWVIGTCRIEASRDRDGDDGRGVRWVHHHFSPDGAGPWLSLGHQDDAHWFQFADGPCFRVHNDDFRVEVFSGESEAADWEIEALFLNHVVPLMLAHRGYTALHASAVEFAPGAALFLGETGSGKSTLAGHLARSGHRLLTDDCAVLQLDESPPLVLPGYPAIRVVDESQVTSPRFRGKAILSPPEFPFPFSPEPSTVAAVFHLDPKPDGAIEIEPLSARDTQFALTRHAFRLDPGDAARLRDEFETLGRLAGQLPAYRLSYPHDERLLPSVADAIRARLEEDAGDNGAGHSTFCDLRQDVRLA